MREKSDHVKGDRERAVNVCMSRKESDGEKDLQEREGEVLDNLRIMSGKRHERSSRKGGKDHTELSCKERGANILNDLSSSL